MFYGMLAKKSGQILWQNWSNLLHLTQWWIQSFCHFLQNSKIPYLLFSHKRDRMSAASDLILFLWSEFCFCRAVWCLTWDGLYCPMKTWLSRDVGRKFNCLKGKIPPTPSNFVFLHKDMEKNCNLGGQRKKNIWKPEVFSGDFEREQEFMKKEEVEKTCDLLDWPRISHILLFLFSKLPHFLISHLLALSCSHNYSRVEVAALCRIALNTYYFTLWLIF